MSTDSGSGAATQPTGNQPAAVQPTANASNFVQVSADDYARYKRAEEQARGAAQFYEKAKAAGFDRPEAFESYAQKQARLKQYGVNIDGILSSFESEKGDAGGAPVVDTDQIIAKATEAARAAADETWNRRTSESAHKEALGATGKAIDEWVDKVDGLSATHRKWLKSDLRGQAEAARRSNENLYDDSHPLRSYDFRPLPGDKLSAILDATKKEIAAVTAQALEAKGVAAQKPSGSPAGQGTAQGKPNNDKATVPFGKLSREEQAEIAKAHLAKKGRGGAAVSTVAGG